MNKTNSVFEESIEQAFQDAINNKPRRKNNMVYNKTYQLTTELVFEHNKKLEDLLIRHAERLYEINSSLSPKQDDADYPLISAVIKKCANKRVISWVQSAVISFLAARFSAFKKYK